MSAIAATGHSTWWTTLNGWVCTRQAIAVIWIVKCIISRRRLSSNTGRTGHAIAVLVHGFWLAVHGHLHRFIAAFHIVVTAKTVDAGSASGTPTWSLVVASKCIASGKFPTAFWADVISLTSVELRMALEIVQTSEAGLTRRTDVWFLLTVRQ
jgi:hypothetical protein